MIVVDNHLTLQECQYIINEWYEIPNRVDGNNTYFNDMVCDTLNIKNNYVIQLINKVIEKAIIKISKHYHLTKPLYPDTIQIVKWDTGKEMGEHVDDGEGSYWRNYSIVIYLNDDYIGGEFLAPDDELYLKPKTGQLVFFKSSARHGVKKVISGTRYTLITWLTFDDRHNVWHYQTKSN